ncbi:O-antigen/teichoic acid export membrane protein [Flavobacterium sp. 103]|uniref:lipopolysaccharide biosynthesis protein n=1 Tax=Flavobacterium sp. 103 TaxID=2135624 RepID=UPI000D5EFF65|nr:lipopolysaccharide biosynthesis protein [Flavobacterium sp. 103]PVX46584.1 O-antigen/teichoic acid export membrane protein [Flavobacterium sp. 103]
MLKQKLIASAKWNGLGRLATMISDFSFGIILARLLLPSDFGVIAILTVFVSFLGVFVNSGFSQALIREKNVSNIDYSTVFYFNLIVAVVVFIISFFSAPYIATFYENENISLYLRVLSISLFIDAFVLVQQSILTKEMNFRMLSIISISSSLFSGITSICLAFYGFGIWSLILKSLLKDSLILLFTIYIVKWRPQIMFSIGSFRKYFKYGVYMLGSSLISQFYNNVFSLTVGKVFSPTVLGFYNRAELFKNTLSQNIDGIISGVSYPALASLQDDKIEFVNYYKNILQFSFYVVSILMIGLMLNAEALINVLLGEKWMGSVKILQYLCLIGLLFPINSITVNSISVTGRSNVYFKFQLFSIIGCLFSLVFGYYFGVISMIRGFVVISFLLLLWIVYIFNKLFYFSIFELIKLLKNSIVSIVLLALSFSLINVLISDYTGRLIVNAFVGMSIVILSGYLSKGKEFLFMQNQLKSILYKVKN